jgi:hypothetical protein
MGLASSKSKTSSKSNSTATSTPTLPSYLQGPATSIYGQIGDLASSNYRGSVNPATGNQTSAFNGAANLGGLNQSLTDAMGSTRGLMNFTPNNVSAQGITAPGAYQPQNVSAQQISAGQLANTNMSAYMNPYTNEVIDRSLADLERSRQGAISNTQGQATAAGAFGGSRHGVADSLTNREFADSAGSLAANLRNAGWTQALGSAQFDIGNRLGADQYNSSSGMQAALANQGAGLTAGLAANSDQMQAQQFNASSALQAALANQNAGLQGANFRLGAANQLGSQGMAQDANTRANLGMQADLGAQERDINQQNDPQEAYMRYLAQLQALYGINPNALIQQNQTGQQTSSGTTTSSPSGIGMLGSLFQGVSALPKGLFPSDRRLKREIVPVGDDERGNRWYEFEYIWDAPGVKSFGVMADEAPAHAVHRQPNGFDYVDYGAL